MENKLEVVFSPALMPYHDVRNKTVVVIDILRATSSMCVAFQTGVNKILPVSSVEECLMFREFDFLCAAERDAQKVAGFDLGNSPFEFQNPLLAGKNIAFTTTNGTKSIKVAKELGASRIYIGAFLNMNALCNRLANEQNDTLLLCAGWKDRFNLEDALFAGAVAHTLCGQKQPDGDDTQAAIALYQMHQHNLDAAIRKASHARRFQLLQLQTDDIAFCLQHNLTHFVPEMEGEYLIVK